MKIYALRFKVYCQRVQFIFHRLSRKWLERAYWKSKDKAKNDMMYQDKKLHMPKYKKMKIYYPIISCKAWNSPAEYPSWVARCDIKGSDGTMLNPIFWKKVQGQKHPGRWGFVKHQINYDKALYILHVKDIKGPKMTARGYMTMSLYG